MKRGEFLGQPISMDFFLFQPTVIVRQIAAADLAVDDVIERGPYAPEVGYTNTQTRA
jgi:hypothetical protein